MFLYYYLLKLGIIDVYGVLNFIASFVRKLKCFFAGLLNTSFEKCKSHDINLQKVPTVAPERVKNYVTQKYLRERLQKHVLSSLY